MLRITLVLFIVGGTVAQISLRRPCPNIETVKNFDLERFKGKWFETALYSNQPVTGPDCLIAKYTPRKDGSFDIDNTQTVPRDPDPYFSTYKAVPTSNGHDGKFTIERLHASYWILATDYKDWALLWSCRISGEDRIRSGWFFTRTGHPSDAVIEAARGAVRARKMNVDYFHILDNSPCPGY